MITADQLTDILEYDPQTGAVYRNDIELDFTVGCKPPKPLRNQCMTALPIKPQSWKPSQVGYSVTCKNTYDKVMRGDTDVRVGTEWSNKLQKPIPVMHTPRKVFERHYRIKTKGGQLETKTYYLIENARQYPRLVVLGKQYMIHHLIYLYMGYAVPKHRIPCRDNNGLNLAWANIKPDADTYKDKPDKKIKPVESVRTMYAYSRCISAYYDKFSVCIEKRVSYADTYEQAIVTFHEMVSQLRGSKRKNSKGVRVTRPYGSHYWLTLF